MLLYVIVSPSLHGLSIISFYFLNQKQMGCYQNKVSVIILDEEISRYVYCLMWEPAEGFSNKFLNKVFSSVFIPGS